MKMFRWMAGIAFVVAGLILGGTLAIVPVTMITTGLPALALVLGLGLVMTGFNHILLRWYTKARQWAMKQCADARQRLAKGWASRRRQKVTKKVAQNAHTEEEVPDVATVIGTYLLHTDIQGFLKVDDRH